jgi:3'-phosphoadenosine 5'-phosphosulfate (PAPS) 3'-phosphatase
MSTTPALAMQAGIAFESKADGSPVTAADKPA